MRGKKVRCGKCNFIHVIPVETTDDDFESAAFMAIEESEADAKQSSDPLGDDVHMADLLAPSENPNSSMKSLAATKAKSRSLNVSSKSSKTDRTDISDGSITNQKALAQATRPLNLDKLHLGLRCVLFGNLLFYAITFVCIVLLLFVASPLFYVLIWILDIGALSVILFGTYFCRYVPKSTKLRPIISWVFILDAIGLGMLVLEYFADYHGEESFTLTIFSICQSLVNAIAFFMFLIFLKRLAVYVNQKGIAAKASDMLLHTSALILYELILGLLILPLTRTLGCFGLMIVLPSIIALLFMWIAWLNKYISFLSELDFQVHFDDSDVLAAPGWYTRNSDQQQHWPR